MTTKKQEAERVTIAQIIKLFEAQFNLTPKDFNCIFGESLAYHLWQKYEILEFNFLVFFNSLSPKNRQLLIEAINRGDYGK